MKVIIAGSRGLLVFSDFIESLCNFHRICIEEVVSGTAAGIDKSGEYFAEKYRIPVKKFPANWDKHGKAAGHIRNKEMADYADELILIWDGESRGSANMKENMIKLGKPVYEIILRKHNV
jgi:hypothetical protein